MKPRESPPSEQTPKASSSEQTLEVSSSEQTPEASSSEQPHEFLYFWWTHELPFSWQTLPFQHSCLPVNRSSYFIGRPTSPLLALFMHAQLLRDFLVTTPDQLREALKPPPAKSLLLLLH